MGLSTAMNSALSGLRASTAGLDLVSNNVANAETPGYTKKKLNVGQSIVGDKTSGVRVYEISRELDVYVQRQLRTELSGLGYTDVRATYTDRLQSMFGVPGDDQALDALVNAFGASLDALVTSPDSVAARSDVLNKGQILAQSLNGLTQDVQSLRGEADKSLQNIGTRVNDILSGLEQVARNIAASGDANNPPAALLDQRDSYIAELAQYMDINVVRTTGENVSVLTGSGFMLFDGARASQVEFDMSPPVGAETQYSTDPAKRTIGTLNLVDGAGNSIDLLGRDGVRSGQIRALADMRDQVLPQAQKQLDELAAQLAQAFSSVETPSQADTSASLDIGTLTDGQQATFTIDDNGTRRTVTIVAYTPPSVDPSTNTDPNNLVVGFDTTSATVDADVGTALGTALGSGFTVDVADWPTVTVSDDGAANKTDIVSVASASITPTYSRSNSLDLATLTKSGNRVETTAVINGVERKITFVRVDNPALLPLAADVTADPNDIVIGLDFSGGAAAAATQARAALGANLPPSMTIGGAGSTISITDAATGASVSKMVSITAASAVTDTGSAALPLFVDGAAGQPYTGALEGNTERLGFAGRITINQDLLRDPSRLTIFQTTDPPTSDGDPTRATFLRDAFEQAGRYFSADTGLAGSAAAFKGSLSSFARSMVDTQAATAAAASQVNDGQNVVVTQLMDRYNETSAVDVDEEMARLLQLQTNYAANARVMSTVSEMLDLLMQMGN